MPRFNHQCSIGFTVLSDNEDGEDFTPEMLRAALLQRIADLDRAGADEWREAVAIEDTDENE
jgi:hypothetical protein